MFLSLDTQVSTAVRSLGQRQYFVTTIIDIIQHKAVAMLS
jgi:hypothetical protein